MIYQSCERCMPPRAYFPIQAIPNSAVVVMSKTARASTIPDRADTVDVSRSLDNSAMRRALTTH